MGDGRVMVRTIAWSFGLLVPLATAARADTLSVPVDHLTIQAAIDAAVDGDVIMVSAGTYFETIDFLGKDISVRSRGGVASTIIDGGGAGSVVTIINGESEDCLLEGFTIRGGIGSAAAGHASAGGGILIVDSSPRVRCCTIRENFADIGGGVFVGGAAPSPTELFACVIEQNDADLGGGFAQEGAWLRLTESIIRFNTAGSQGGGFYARPLSEGAASYRTSIISDNDSSGGGGGGTFILDEDEGSFVVGECLFQSNAASGPGGGLNIVSHAVGGGLTEFGNIGATDFLANEASRGGGLAVTGTTDNTTARFTIHRCLFARNVVDGLGLGGALWTSLVGTQVQVTSSTLVDNVASAGGGALYTQGPDDSGSSFHGCLFWGNGPLPFDGVLAADWSYSTCDIEGGVPTGSVGGGNVELPPRFYDPPVFDYSVTDDDPSAIYGSENGNDDPWSPIRVGLPGAEGFGNLAGAGTLTPGSIVSVQSTNLPKVSPGVLIIGLSADHAAFFGGTMVPSPDYLVPFVTSSLGGAGVGILGTLPNDTPPGFEFFVQEWVVDRCATQGLVATNAIKCTTR